MSRYTVNDDRRQAALFLACVSGIVLGWVLYLASVAP